MGEEKDVGGITINATKLQVEEFKESILWADMCNELTFWLDGLEVEKSHIVNDIAEKNLSSAAVISHISSIDGRKKAIQYMLSLPEVFLNILEERNDSKRK